MLVPRSVKVCCSHAPHLFALFCSCSSVYAIGLAARSSPTSQTPVGTQELGSSLAGKSRINRVTERSLEVNRPTIWTDGKAGVESSQRRERVRRKKMQVREKVEKSQGTVLFPGGSKSRLAAAGAEPSGEMRHERLYAVLARSSFGSQTAKITTC